MKDSMSGRSSRGSVESRGASARASAGCSVSRVTFFTLSQFSSISTPPASLKLMSLPRRLDCTTFSGHTPSMLSCTPLSIFPASPHPCTFMGSSLQSPRLLLQPAVQAIQIGVSQAS